MDTIRLFVASSCEISNTRRNLVIRAAEKNKLLRGTDTRVEVDEWEFESAAVPVSGRSQDEYNRLLAQSDLATVLVKNKTGKYTIEEFETALTLFRTAGRPKICVYALPPDKEEPSRLEFLKELRGGRYALDYFPQEVKDENELWIGINGELDRIIGARSAARPFPQTGDTFIGRQVNVGEGGIYNETNYH